MVEPPQPSSPTATVSVFDDNASVRKARTRLLRLRGLALQAFDSPFSFLDASPEAVDFIRNPLRTDGLMYAAKGCYRYIRNAEPMRTPVDFREFVESLPLVPWEGEVVSGCSSRPA